MTYTGSFRFVMSVLVADRVGILRDITAAVRAQQGRLNGISQTVVEGYFTVILTATFETAREPAELKQAIEAMFPAGEASVAVQACGRERPRPPVPGGERYILTLSSEGHPDVMQRVTAFLAEKGANVEDWYMEETDTRLTHIGEITVPARLDVTHVQEECRALLAPLQVHVAIQHENIFRATSEIGAISPLLRNRTHHA